MTSMFWGLRMEPGKRYSTTVGRSFHVSMASLDCTSVKQDNEINSVMLEEGESKVPFILCNLQKQKILQCPLDLNFMTGDRVTFFCLGSGIIHLSGYVHDDPEDDDLNLLGEEEEEEEDEDEVEEAEDESASPKSKKKKENGISLKRKQLEALVKKAKMSKLDEDVDDESDDDEDEDDVMKMDGLSSDDEAVDDEGAEEEDDEGDESEDDDDDEEQVEEEETVAPKKMKQKMKEMKAKLQKNAQKPNGISPTQPSKKDKSKNDASPAPQSQKEAQKQKAPGKKTIEGGVQIKDIKVGSGKVCTPGKKASVYYIGRFRDNNKVFDSARKGNGFTFSVGKGEVIKGWDVGVVGMKVGGKRTIVCPPNMAYGQKGSPPTIPGNSTLVFEVELKNVN